MERFEGGRIPPHNHDAEKSVLGSMIKDREAFMLGQESLSAADFYDPAHQVIFEEMMGLGSRSQPVDLVTLDDALSRSGKLAGVGGIEYLIDLTNFVPTTANVSAYIRIVEENSTLRKLIAASGHIAQQSYVHEEETSAIMSEAERLIYDITMRKGGQTLRHIHPVLIDTYGQIVKLYESKGSPDGVMTGFYDLDDMLTGLHPGELVILAARPSMGKSTIGMNIVQNAALREKQKSKAAVFSLEMPAEQLAMRMICAQGEIDLQNIRHGRISDDEFARMTVAISELSQTQVYMDCTPGITVNELRSRCRRLKLEHGLDLVMVDYLQLMSGSGKTRSRQEEVSEISRDLKGLAQELGVPLVALSQLSRASQGRSDHRPILSDLRDSGAIEQDADVVMFLHREDYYNKDAEEKNVGEIIIAKQRNGPLGTVKLAFRGEYSRFYNLSSQVAPR